MDETSAKMRAVVGESFDKGCAAGNAAGRDTDHANQANQARGMSVVVEVQGVDLIGEVQAAYKVLSQAGRQDLFGLVQKLLEEQQAAKV